MLRGYNAVLDGDKVVWIRDRPDPKRKYFVIIEVDERDCVADGEEAEQAARERRESEDNHL